jgi:hypothetical protein
MTELFQRMGAFGFGAAQLGNLNTPSMTPPRK